MANEISLPTHRDSRGRLTVIDGTIPFPIVRAYYIYDCAGSTRGGHRHKKTRQALVCIKGFCTVDWTNGVESGSTRLDHPDRLLILEPEDWHLMRDFSEDAILLVLANERYDPSDYIHEGYDT
jgi:dTDP-4-dehydrorhamnose 3,5-epimerase-like enzyme